MNVRACFECTSITPFYEHQEACPGATILFSAVGHDGENVDWSQWTPSGTLSMDVTNPSAVSAFKVGQRYYLDFSEAP